MGAKKKHYTNRELSWLQFNERVLNEAGNPRVPLAERLSFASIYQSNLDEFFMVRVGSLMAQAASGEILLDNKTGLSSQEQTDEILKRVSRLEEEKTRIYEQLMGELEPEGIRIINFNRLSNKEGKLLEEYFDAHIAPFLSPMVIGKRHPFPFLLNKQLYAIVILSKGKKTRIGMVPCSNSVFKRLIEIPTRPGTFMLSEELILHFVSKLYPKYNIECKSLIRVTRNADIDASDYYDDETDYRNLMEKLIKRRTRLNAVRLELSREIDDKSKAQLAEYVGISLNHVLNVRTPLDLSFVFQLQNYLSQKPEKLPLFYEKRVPQNSMYMDSKASMIAQIKEKDRLLSYPYESIKPFIKLLQEAAEDESVVSIKMTLYRVAERSQIIDALIEAAENGKQVVVIVELRARFDEANNIELSKRLEEAGCQILYGLGEYKVHSKLCLITLNNGNELSYVTQVGTGNYNEKTARLYTDLCLMTANENIGKEAARVFDALLKGDTVRDMKELLVAPNCLQNRVLEMIDEEIEKAKAGQAAYVGAKINSLTDKDIIDKLIEAAKAGVKVELIIRGICCLKPDMKKAGRNITIVSVVGRFLEHSRIYRFGSGEQEKIYIASADFMTRNTLKRVEVGVPIYDMDIRARIVKIFEALLRDDEKGKELNAEGIYCDRNINQPRFNAQEYFYEIAYDNASKVEKAE